MSTSAKLVVGLGEVLWDVFPEGAKIGGAPANFAYHASALGFEAMAISAVGDDALGEEAKRIFDEKHLRYHLETVPYLTGEVSVSLDKDGVPTYDIKEGVAWDHIPFSKAMETLAKDTLAVCFGSLAQRGEVSRETIRRYLSAVPQEALRIYDINLRLQYYSLEVIEWGLRACNLLKINDDEIVIVSDLMGLDIQEGYESAIRSLMQSYEIDIVVLTCGTRGSYVFSSDKSLYLPTPKVEVVDTVGAGDSFTAAFVSALLSGRSLEEAHKSAVQLSAYVCGQHGAMPSYSKDLLTF